MDKFTYETYKKMYNDFQDDELAKRLYENTESAEYLNEKYGDSFVSDVVLPTIDNDVIAEYAASKCGSGILDYFDEDELLEHVSDKDIEEYVEDNCYNRVFGGMFKRHLRDAEYFEGIEDGSIASMITSIARSLTRRPLDKETIKEVINEYINNNFYNTQMR